MNAVQGTSTSPSEIRDHLDRYLVRAVLEPGTPARRTSTTPRIRSLVTPALVADRRAIGNKTGVTRLGFAVLSRFFELEARFPDGPNEVPVEVVAYLAGLVEVPWTAFTDYRWEGRTIGLHRSQIRARFGFRPATDEDAGDAHCVAVDEVAALGERVEVMVQAVLDRCRRDRIEPPSPGRIARLVGSARARFDDRFARLTGVVPHAGGDRRVERIAQTG